MQGRPPNSRIDAADDSGAWGAFVEATAHGSYLQLSGWASVKAANGWAARRILVGEPGRRIGLQLLIRRTRPLPWVFGYAPRGPLARRLFTDRDLAVRARVGQLPGRRAMARPGARDAAGDDA